MEFIRQAYQHNPPHSYGDCQRTATAMVLGVPRDAVPNFGVHYGDMEGWNKARKAFFDELHLYSVEVPIASHSSFEAAFEAAKNWARGAPFIFSGHSTSGNDHSVAVSEEGIIHDPATTKPGDCTLVGPCRGNHWWMEVFAVKPTFSQQLRQYKAFYEFAKSAPISADVCCCGEPMKGHSDPMSCGHNPRDEWDYQLSSWAKALGDTELK